MATNPMQRKARNSFLLGMLLMLIITGVIIALLILQLTNMKKEEQEELAAMVQVYTLTQNVTSGQEITPDMLQKHEVNKDMVPDNATSDLTNFQNYFLEDEAGNSVTTKYENGEAQLTITRDDREYELIHDTETDTYYIQDGDDRETIILNEAPLIAKVDLLANTVITTDLVSAGDSVQNSTRKQEFNMFVLPSDLVTGDYVDIRLQLPSGPDYIIVSKKQVEIPSISGVDSTNTISIDLTEDEINLISNAIVDAFKINGAKLYVNKYTDPGIQEASIPTYPVNAEVMELINGNPNIIEEARNALWNRYLARDTNDTQTQAAQRNDVINPLITADPNQAQSNLETNMEESITNSITTRQEYLEGLSAQATATTTTTNTTTTTTN